MPRGKSWSYSDEQDLIEAYNERKTIRELCEMFPDRNRKALYRKIESLRLEGKVGYKNIYDMRKSVLDTFSHKKKDTGLKDDDWGDTSWE